MSTIHTFCEETGSLGKLTRCLGLLSLFLTLAVSLQRPCNRDLLLLIPVGYALCEYRKMKGGMYALILLFIAASLRHLFFGSSEYFFRQVGVNLSASLGFLLSSLGAEWDLARECGLREQNKHQEEAIRLLEEGSEEKRAGEILEQTRLLDRLSILQKESDEALLEVSSLSVLNEILRKNLAAKDLSESHKGDERESVLLDEIEALKHRLSGLSDANLLEGQKNQLLKELNESRFAREHTHQINETLASMLAASVKRARELEGKLLPSSEGLLRKDLSEVELSLEAALIAKERVQSLYAQLKMQFQEKNEILGLVRSELFLTDTVLFAKERELEELLLRQTPSERELMRAVEIFERQYALQAEENQELTALVSQLCKTQSNLQPLIKLR